MSRSFMNADGCHSNWPWRISYAHPEVCIIGGDILPPLHVTEYLCQTAHDIRGKCGGSEAVIEGMEISDGFDIC